MAGTIGIFVLNFNKNKIICIKQSCENNIMKKIEQIVFYSSIDGDAVIIR